MEEVESSSLFASTSRKTPQIEGFAAFFFARRKGPLARPDPPSDPNSQEVEFESNRAHAHGGVACPQASGASPVQRDVAGYWIPTQYSREVAHGGGERYPAELPSTWEVR
jgi:hypothetical protein